MSDTANELRRRVDERMKPIERQIRQDYDEAWTRLSEAEKRDPDIALNRLNQLVCEIEAKRATDRLKRVERLVEVLRGANEEVADALASMYVRGQEKAFKQATEMVELMAYEMWGQSYISAIAQEIVKERRDELTKKYGKGNGHG